jgi:hypothetical protein
MADDKTADARGAKGDRAMLTIGLPIVIVAVLATALISMRFANGLDPSSASAVIGPDHLTDGIATKATVTNIDPAKAEMTIRLAMDPVGVLDDGGGLLARPVTLYYESVDGTKQIDFKAGKPLGTTDLAVPLVDGTISSYPWDQYRGDIALSFYTVGDLDPKSTSGDPAGTTPSTTPSATTPTTEGTNTSEPPTSTPPGTTATTAAPADGGANADEPASLRTRTRAAAADEPAAEKKTETPDTIVPSTMEVYENVPAYNVLDISGDVKDNVLEASFEAKRAPAAIFFSCLVTIVMWALALGVFYIALSVIVGRRKLELAHMTMMAAILFALPAALRSSQPGIPPPGVLSDFYGFFFCDVIVAASLIAILVTYLWRKPA